MSTQSSSTTFTRLSRDALIASIRLYQRTLSHLVGGQCRFHPTCSHYAIAAIDEHGSGKGMLLAAGRILRCNPFSEGGYDPVPAVFSLTKKLKS